MEIQDELPSAFTRVLGSTRIRGSRQLHTSRYMAEGGEARAHHKPVRFVLLHTFDTIARSNEMKINIVDTLMFIWASMRETIQVIFVSKSENLCSASCWKRCRAWRHLRPRYFPDEQNDRESDVRPSTPLWGVKAAFEGCPSPGAASHSSSSYGSTIIVGWKISRIKQKQNKIKLWKFLHAGFLPFLQTTSQHHLMLWPETSSIFPNAKCILCCTWYTIYYTVG